DMAFQLVEQAISATETAGATGHLRTICIQHEHEIPRQHPPGAVNAINPKCNRGEAVIELDTLHDPAEVRVARHRRRADVIAFNKLQLWPLVALLHAVNQDESAIAVALLSAVGQPLQLAEAVHAPHIGQLPAGPLAPQFADLP